MTPILGDCKHKCMIGPLESIPLVRQSDPSRRAVEKPRKALRKRRNNLRVARNVSVYIPHGMLMRAKEPSLDLRPENEVPRREGSLEECGTVREHARRRGHNGCGSAVDVLPTRLGGETVATGSSCARARTA